MRDYATPQLGRPRTRVRRCSAAHPSNLAGGAHSGNGEGDEGFQLGTEAEPGVRMDLKRGGGRVEVVGHWGRWDREGRQDRGFLDGPGHLGVALVARFRLRLGACGG